MVQWTSPFMIGITDVSLNSDDVLFQPLTGFTSSFPNQPNILRKVEDGCVDIYFYDWHFFDFIQSPRLHSNPLEKV